MQNYSGIDVSSQEFIDELSLYAENEINVLLIGLHGVGKTAVVKQVFSSLFGDRWKYFSASTMDPWVDFVGVPDKVKQEDKSYALELVRPKSFQAGEVEAIFMDEFNRSKDKVRNAVMELIQFKSINGVKFPNLKVVWAAINPDDEEEEDTSYDVERLDDAQRDRFQIQIPLPYRPSEIYFEKRYSEAGLGACEWWHNLNDEQKLNVSPRRLEDAIRIFELGGNLEHVIGDETIDLQTLRTRLVSGSVTEKLAELYRKNDDVETAKVFSNINFENDTLELIINEPKYIERFTPFLEKENLSRMLTQDKGKYAEEIVNNSPADTIAPILSSVIAASGNDRQLQRELRRFAQQRGLDLNSQENFLNAIEDGLKVVGGTNNERYTALQTLGQVFNDRASMETYEKSVLFIAQIINHTADASLADSGKPYNQIGMGIIKRTETALKKQNTNVMEVWENLRKTKFKNADSTRMERIERNLQKFLSS